MLRSLYAAALALLALCLVACGGNATTAPPTPSATTPPTALATAATAPTATATPAPTATPLPLDTTTGIGAADHFLQLLAARDVATIAAEAVFPPQPCTQQRTGIPGKPVCGPGATEGDLVPAEMIGSCEPGFLAPDERQRILDRLSLLSGATQSSLDSVWQTDAFGASYAIVVDFSSNIPGTSGTAIFYVDDDGHFEGSTACGDTSTPTGHATRVFPP